jgi:hypothetical protein
MRNADIEILGKAAYALGKYLPETEFALFKDYLRVYESLKAKNDNEKQRYQEKAEYHRAITKKWREENPEKQKRHVRNYQEKKRLELEKQKNPSAGITSVVNYSPEALPVLAEYIMAFDKCANEPDETYGAAFIAMEAERERLRKSFTTEEFEAIIINLDDIRETLREAGLIPE